MLIEVLSSAWLHHVWFAVVELGVASAGTAAVCGRTYSLNATGGKEGRVSRGISGVETHDGRRPWLTGGIGAVRRLLEDQAGRLREWARAREAEVDAVGFSPQRRLLLQARVPFHMAFRGACRLSIWLEPARRPVLRRVAVAACATWDLLEVTSLRRDPRLRLGTRLAADLADTATWSAFSGRAYSVVPIIGVPLVTETALRYRWAGAPLPIAHLLAAGAARRLAHKPVEPMRLGPQVLAFFFGLGLRRVERGGAQRVRASFEAELRAAETTAAIAGQYRVARSTYVLYGEPINPHDVLSGIRLHFPSARDQPSALHELTWGGRKGALEALAAERAVQLDTALRAWRRDTNVTRSALSAQVLDPTLPEGHGMALLSGEQVARLGEVLEALDVRGAFAVEVVEAARPGARVVLVVNGRRVVVPPDPPRLVVVRADPTPVAMLEGGVLYALLEATDAADAAPLWSVLPGIAAFGGVAAWSRRALRARGAAAHESMISLSAMAALAQALFVHAAVRGQPDRPDGTQRTPMQVALSAPTLLVGFCWASLGPGSRWRAGVAFAILSAIGIALLEPPRWRLDLLRNALWLPALFLPSFAYGAGGEREAHRARAELTALQTRAADEAARQGERSEWERVRVACEEGLASLDSVSPSARPAIARRLEDLHCLAEEQLNANE